MRILEVSASGTIGTRDMGPVSTTICALVNGFARLGHAVTIVDAPEGAPRATLHAAVAVVTVERLLRRRHSIRTLPSKVQLLYTWVHALLYVWSVKRRVDLESFDVVHVHDAPIACLLAVLSRTPYYYTSHSTVWALERESGAALSLGHRLEKGTESFAIRRSRTSIGMGDYLQRELPGAHVTTIPNGIEPAGWLSLGRSVSRATLGLAADEFVIVFVGRIHPSKGVDVLVEAVRKIASSVPRLRVFAIGPLGGDFHLRTAPSAYAADVMSRASALPICFTGFLANDSRELRTYLSAADVGVFPSRVEPFGKVALEALAMSLPIIAARTGGLAQIISDDVGFLVPPGDVDALAAAMRRAHDHPEQLALRRARCRARVINKYTCEQLVERHLALFESRAAAACTALGESS